MKKLPSIKKNIKSFLLDENAKVVDKTATRIALTSAVIGFALIDNIDNGNAIFVSNHANHSNHNNAVNALANGETYNHAGNNPTSEVQGDGNLPEKSVTTAHANHFNHGDQTEDQAGWLDIVTILSFPDIGAFATYYLLELLFIDDPSLASPDTEFPYILDPEILNELAAKTEIEENRATFYEGGDGTEE